MVRFYLLLVPLALSTPEREREREANGRGELVSDSSFVRNVRMRGM